MKERQIFFHVGLGKTASTYLQQSIFPKLDGVKYISTHRYKKSKTIIPQFHADKILVSREFDRQFEDEVRWFTQDFPDARIIIVFRRHDEWIASQYKRHVKNGFVGSFEAFLDLENDDGFWETKELDYMRKLDVIEEYSNHPPLILIYDDLRADPESFVRKITDYMGVLPLKKVDLKKRHQSFSEKQLKVLRAFTSKYIRAMPHNYRNKVKHWLLYRPVWAFYHLILYVARFVPENWITDTPLIDEHILNRVREKFLQDWSKLKQRTE